MKKKVVPKLRQEVKIKVNIVTNIETRKKHRGKRRNCSLRAISPFLTVFSFLRLVLQTRKNQGLFGKGF